MFCILTYLSIMLKKRKLLKSIISINNGVTISNLIKKINGKHKITQIKKRAYFPTKIAKSMEANTLILILAMVLLKNNKVINNILKNINGFNNLISQTTMTILNKRKFTNGWNNIQKMSKNTSKIINLNNLGLILTTMKFYCYRNQLH
jgi:hypothetical protein